MTKEHLLFTDGSSLGNPGPGGWGAVVVSKNDYGDPKGRVTEIGGGAKHTTNNKMELTALIEGLSRLGDEKGELMLYIDSQYVIKGATEWSHGWKKRGWITMGKTPVENRELWEELLELLEARKKFGKIIWQYVPGHVGVEGNERADQIATGFARLRADTRGQAAGEQVELFEGDLSDYAIDILNIAIDNTKAENRSASKSRSRAKAYSYLSLVNGVAKRHLTWAECEKRVKGKSGVKYKKALSREDESAILRSWGARL